MVRINSSRSSIVTQSMKGILYLVAVWTVAMIFVFIFMCGILRFTPRKERHLDSATPSINLTSSTALPRQGGDDASEPPPHAEEKSSVMTCAGSCGPEQDHSARTIVKAKMEEKASRQGPTRMMDHLVALYREKDMHAANALQARKQIETDEVDVARLWMAAAR
ncbi:hypothetical protein LTR33_000459 [Friedmanniomyces endolithicus]|nr:hypothetical protein LTR33_000459 [Friedmanniomyces endolithicus]